MNYRVVIPTAGTGSRLGKLTFHINKSLVSIANRPVLSHQIEQFPEECEFVIALGYKGELVREFLNITYPEKAFIYVDVDPFEGPGSGLGYSLMCCKAHLQQPFVFLSCDTLAKEDIPGPSQNWMGCALREDLDSYRTVSIGKKHIKSIHEKGDFSADNLHAYIGLAGIKDHDQFWAAMHEGGGIALEQGEVYGLRALQKKVPLSAFLFTWFDSGSPAALDQARSAYRLPNEPNILGKEKEAIWFVGRRVVKFSVDQHFIANRVQRAEKLKGFTPNLLASTKHMYSYEKVQGRVLSEVVTLPMFEALLQHSKSFWVRAQLTTEQRIEFENKCKEFYCNKTRERVNLFYQNFGKQDGSQPINDEPMPLMSTLLSQVDWETLSKGIPGRFHGDFHFENIIWRPESKTFTFLDWRQDFGGDLNVGDVYYDLAKLLHGMIVSHKLIAANLFSVIWSDSEIRFDLHRRQVLVDCEIYFSEWCAENGYDYAKIRVLTALIYINIAALHHQPYSLMLYALGKQMLAKELGPK